MSVPNEKIQESAMVQATIVTQPQMVYATVPSSTAGGDGKLEQKGDQYFQAPPQQILSAGVASPLVFTSMQQLECGNGCCIIAFTAPCDSLSCGVQHTCDWLCLSLESSCCVCRNEKCYVQYMNYETLSLCKWPQCYLQYFCCHCFSWYSLEALTEMVKIEPKYGRIDGNTDNMKAIPCGNYAGWCSLMSCFCEFPACLSNVGSQDCICIHREYVCGRMLCYDPNPAKEGLCCLWMKYTCSIQNPTTCCKTHEQTCCLDTRCALPCDDTVPCTLYYLPFCTCCVNWQCDCRCCASVEDLSRGKGQQNVQPQYQQQQQQQIYLQQPQYPQQVQYLQPQLGGMQMLQ